MSKFKFTQEELPLLYSMLHERTEGILKQDECVEIIESIISERWVSDDEIWINGKEVSIYPGQRMTYNMGADWMRSRIFKTDEK